MEDADMEDFGDSTPRPDTAPRIAFVARKPRRREASPEPEADAVNKPVPRASANYKAFLKAMRPRWRARLAARHGGQTDATMPAMFASARALTRTGHRWDIVQLRPTRHPGRFVMWVQVDTELASIPVRIPREFYLHTRTPAPEDIFRRDVYECERVVRGLPRGLPCTNLYKISVREDYFVEGQSHFIDLMNDPNVDNVYETKVSTHPYASFRCTHLDEGTSCCPSAS
jgi:DNA polymerase epsilon subunit 1